MWRLRPRRNWLLLIPALVVVALFGAVILGRRPKPQDARLIVSTSSVPSGIPQTLRLNGKTEASRARAILAPLLSDQQVGMLTITKLVPKGSRVKKGDILVEFDNQAELRDFLDKQAASDDQNGKVLQEQAKEDAARTKDETEIEQAQNSL